MNNLKKLGATALAGSLVAVSAQAGELSVTGHATATLKTKGGSGMTAQTLGHNTAINFSGSGELDNGYTWNTFVLMADGLATISSSALTMTMGSMGTVSLELVVLTSMVLMMKLIQELMRKTQMLVDSLQVTMLDQLLTITQ